MIARGYTTSQMDFRGAPPSRGGPSQISFGPCSTDRAREISCAHGNLYLDEYLKRGIEGSDATRRPGRELRS